MNCDRGEYMVTIGSLMRFDRGDYMVTVGSPIKELPMVTIYSVRGLTVRKWGLRNPL